MRNTTFRLTHRTIAGADSPERQRTLAMIVARILDPGSKLATARWAWPKPPRATPSPRRWRSGRRDEDDLYAAMDWLLERSGCQVAPRAAPGAAPSQGRRAACCATSPRCIWNSLRRCPLGSPPRGAATRATAGVASSCRSSSGCCALAQGRPVAVEVFHGNTADPATVGARRSTSSGTPLRVLQGGVGGRPRHA